MTRISSMTGGFSGYTAVSKSFAAGGGGGGDDEYNGATMLFAQTSAPTGWSKITTYNDYSLRVVSGTVTSGGTDNFSSVFADKPFSGSLAATADAGPWTLSTPELPAHNHTVPRTAGQVWGGLGTTSTAGNYGPLNAATGPGGGGQSHNHPGSPITLSLSGSLNLSIKYVDAILASF